MGFVIIAAVLTVACAVIAILAHRKLDAITGTPTSPMGSVAPGRVEIQGQVSDQSEIITSPLSRKPCVYFHFKVEQYRQRQTSNRSGSWHTVLDETSVGQLVLEDGTGACVVDIQKANVILSTDHRSSSGTFDQATPAEEEALRTYGRSSKGWVFNKKMRYYETLLEVGDSLYALGSTDARGELPTITKGDGPFIVSDRGEEALTSRYKLQRAIAGAAGSLILVLLAMFWNRIPW